MDPAAHIDSVELRVADLERCRRFYERALGLEHTGADPLSLGVDGRTLLVLREADPGTPAPPTSTGLFHVAYRHPTRAGLASALRRLAASGARLTGASDHGVSEALYLDDPDRNGIEVYWDRPMDDWPWAADGGVDMYTAPLDLESLVAENDAVEPNDPATDIGHVHLRVSDLERAISFYRDELGMGLRARLGDQAGFLAAGDYHHHVGVNTWQSRGGGPPPPGSAGLESFTIAVPSAEQEPEERSDPDGIRIRLVAQ